MSTAAKTPVLALIDLIEKGASDSSFPEAAARLFAPDGYYQMRIPATERLVGPDAIVAELLRQTSHYASMTCELLGVVSEGAFVVTERIDHLTLPNGHKASNVLTAVFEVNEDGLITAWREYWDAQELSRRMTDSNGA